MLRFLHPAVPVIALLAALPVAQNETAGTAASTLERDAPAAATRTEAPRPADEAETEKLQESAKESDRAGFCSTLSPQLMKMTQDAWRRR